MSDFSAKLRALRATKDMTLDELAALLGTTKQVLSRYENGTRTPKITTVDEYAKKLGIPLTDLLPSDGPAFRNVQDDNSCILTPKGQKIGRTYEKAPTREQGLVDHVLEPYMEVSNDFVPKLPEEEIEMVEMKVYFEASAAGSGDYLTDSDSYEILPFPVDEVPAWADFGVRIAGQSMEPFIEDGSIAWVEYMPSVNSGDIGIFILNGDSYCKKLDVDTKDRKVWLLSLNVKSDDIEVGDEDDLRTVGKVLL